MHKRLIVPLLLVIAVIASACGSSTEEVAGDAADAVGETEIAEVEDTADVEETSDTEAPETTTEPPVSEDPPAEETGDSADGMALYEANCSRCHESDGTGSRGPSLLGIADRDADRSRSISQITNGGRNMPAFGDQLSEPEITAIIDYTFEAFPAAS